VHFIVRAEVNGSPVFSPTVALSVVKPLTKTQKSEAVNGQTKAVSIWQAQLARFGDTLKPSRAVPSNSGMTLTGGKKVVGYGLGLVFSELNAESF
jgi:hypothetical protein